MKGKGSRGKTSLQKTASSVINIHTHRNSNITTNITELIPFGYNDSLASIRTNSILKNRNYSSVGRGEVKEKKEQEERSRKRKGSKEQAKFKPNKKSDIKPRKDRIFYQMYSESLEGLARDRSTKIEKKDKTLIGGDLNRSVELKAEPVLFAGIETSQTEVLTMLARTKSVLEGYKNYSQQLEKECKRYKTKCVDLVRKLRKQEHK